MTIGAAEILCVSEVPVVVVGEEAEEVGGVDSLIDQNVYVSIK